MLFFILLLLPVGLLLALVGIKFWRITVVGVLGWVLIEGAVRKWVFPAWQAPILQLKDIALIAAYAGFLVANRRPVPQADRVGVLSVLVLLQFVYCFLEVMNPSLPTPMLGFYGLKLYVIYLPLLFVIPEIFKTREQVRLLIFWTCVTAIPIGLLGLYQFSQPPTSWVNKYVSHEVGQEAVASLFGSQEGTGEFRLGRARTSGTFSYIGGFTTYLLLVVPIAASALLGGKNTPRQLLIAGGALMLAIGATFTTGSRTPMVVFALAAPVMLVIAGGKGLLPLMAAMRLAALTFVLSVVTLALFADAATAFWFRAENADSTSERFLSPIVETLAAFDASPLFGLGIGSNSNAGASLVDPSMYWLNLLVEVEPARVMQDLGVAGFVLVYALKIAIVYLVFKWIYWSRSKLFIATYLAIGIFMIPHIILFTVNNPTGGLFFWALGGLAVAMYRIERAERREASAAAMAVVPDHRHRLEPQIAGA